jgi:hypothetical protein
MSLENQYYYYYVTDSDHDQRYMCGSRAGTVTVIDVKIPSIQRDCSTVVYEVDICILASSMFPNVSERYLPKYQTAQG